MAKFGWIPDIPDKRDFFYRAVAVSVPDTVDLRPNCPPVYDQGNLGCCTGFAISSVLEYQHSAQGKGDIHFSELFIYYNERRIEGTIQSDAGASLRDGIKTIATR